VFKSLYQSVWGTSRAAKLYRLVVQSRNYGVSRRAFVISTAAACGFIAAGYEAVMPPCAEVRV
jgi:hypothetical protein